MVQAKVADEERVAERRAELVAAATELFLHQGFHKTTVRGIASALGWQMGKLYLYISRKEDILYLISDAILNEVLGGFRELEPKPTARETLRAASEYLFRVNNRIRREVKLLYRESASLLPEHQKVVMDREREERDILAAIIRDGIERGEFRPVDPELFAHTIIMLAHMWALKGWSLHDGRSFEDYMERQLDLLFCRLLPEASSPQA